MVEKADESKLKEASEDINQPEEDKNRKILRLLELGDVVLDVYNVARVSGLDVCGI